jgi:purine-binding chemotaxis protein CheW
MTVKNDYKDITNSYLTFRLGKEIFAAHVGKVLNILEMTKITPVPQAPGHMLGVINLRGNVLPVVDARIRFGIEDTKYTSDTCIIVTDIYLGNEHVQIGALVDAVNEVIDIAPGDIQPPPSIGSKYKSEYIEGMGKKRDDFIMILDVDRVFMPDDEESLLANIGGQDNKKEEDAPE